MGCFQTFYKHHMCLVFVLTLSTQFYFCAPQVLSSICDKTAQDGTVTYQACFPSAEKLIQSANFNLTVTPSDITCGTPPNVYCTASWQFGCNADATCDAADPLKSHPKKLMVDNDMTTQWISKTASDRNEFPVTIQISFDKLYELAGNLMIVFFSGRPRNMTIEKSSDHGATWTVLQYYSDDCTGFNTLPVTEANPTDVRCTTDYSAADPKNGGIVQFEDRHVLFLTSTLTDYKNLFESLQNIPGLQEFLLFTDFRIKLNFPAIIGNPSAQTLGDYYGISEIQFNGRCICNLHASGCARIDGQTQCLCKHNTQGQNCEQCKPLFNNRVWLKGSYVPYPGGTANECQKCDCNDHALSCFYDDNYKHGVCQGCMDSTMGVKCEECIVGYYHNTSVPLNSPDTCILCDCEAIGSITGSLGCSQAELGSTPIGQCPCIAQVTGRRCDICQDRFYGLLIDPVGQCKECACNTLGTVAGSNICDPTDGQCPCKTSTSGRMCGQCKDGFYGFPLLQSQECTSCSCDWGGSSSVICQPSTGKCTCQNNVQGDKCNTLNTGSYIPFLDDGKLEPVSGTCILGTALQSEVLHDGAGFAKCGSNQVVTFTDINGQLVQPKLQWPYLLGVRYTHNSITAWPPGRLTVSVTGNSGLTDTSGYQNKQSEQITSLNCGAVGQVFTFDVIFRTGEAQAWLSSEAEALVLDARCKYQLSLLISQSNDTTSMIIDSVVLLPSITTYPAYLNSDADTKLLYDDCMIRMSTLGNRQSLSSTCQSLTFSVMTQIHQGALVCQCDPVGSVPATTCNGLGGQCQCKLGVGGINCDTCQSGFYNFTEVGCTECPTDPCPTVVPVTTSPPLPTKKPPLNLTTTPIPDNNGTEMNTTIDNGDSDDSSMVFVYMAIGIFIFLLLLLCTILTVLLIRRCRSIRKLRAENPALVPGEENFPNSGHRKKDYETIEVNSEDGNYVANKDDERLMTASIQSLNLNLQNLADGTEIGLDSQSSTPKLPKKLEDLQMVSTPLTQRGSDKYLSSSAVSSRETTPNTTPKLQRHANKNGGTFQVAPVVMETNFSQPIRQPPDGMALAGDDETKPKKDLKKSVTSTAKNVLSPQASVPDLDRSPTKPVNSMEKNPSTYSEQKTPNSNASKTRDVKNNVVVVLPVKTAQTPNSNISIIPKVQKAENPETGKFDNKPVGISSRYQTPNKPSSVNNPKYLEQKPIINNGTGEMGLKPREVSPQNLYLQPLHKPSPVGSKQSPSRQRRTRQIGILDPQKLVPELNYAGFGEFDEINGSLV